MQTHFNKFL